MVKNCLTEREDLSKVFQVDVDQLELFAEEAVEDGHYELARKYLLQVGYTMKFNFYKKNCNDYFAFFIQKIVKFKCNPDHWLDYAVYCLGMGEIDKAIELIREALSWDIEHQMG